MLDIIKKKFIRTFNRLKITFVKHKNHEGLILIFERAFSIFDEVYTFRPEGLPNSIVIDSWVSGDITHAGNVRHFIFKKFKIRELDDATLLISAPILIFYQPTRNDPFYYSETFTFHYTVRREDFYEEERILHWKISVCDGVDYAYAAPWFIHHGKFMVEQLCRDPLYVA